MSSCPRQPTQTTINHYLARHYLARLGLARWHDGSSKAREGASTARDGATATRRRGTARCDGDRVRWRLLEGKGRRERGKGRRDGYTMARDGAAFVCRESDLSSFWTMIRDNRTRHELLIGAASPIFSQRANSQKENHKNEQKWVVPDLPEEKLFLDTLQE